jgi:integrase
LISDRSAKRSVAVVAEEWQASRVKASPKTRVGHDNILAAYVLPKFGNRRIGSIDPSSIQEWANALAKTHAPSTVDNVFAVLRLVMAFAVRRRYVAVNPCSDIELPTKRRRVKIRPLTHAEVRQLADAMPYAMSRVAVLTAAYAGLRAGELWALKRDDVKIREIIVDEAIKEVTVAQAANLPEGYERLSPSLIIGPTKTEQTRRIAILGFLADELAALIGESHPAPFIFTDSEGGPIRHTNFYKRVYVPNLPKSLAGTRWHDLRHTCASLLIEQGAHPLAVKEQLGHEDIRTTMNTYGHMSPAGQDALAASMDAAFKAAEQPASAPLIMLADVRAGE